MPPSADMKDRIIKNIQSSHAFEVVFDPESQSPLPDMIRTLTSASGRDHFVETSQKMASDLFSMQDGSNPAGLLTALDVSVDRHSALGIIKIEREEGGRLVPDVTREGKKRSRPPSSTT